MHGQPLDINTDFVVHTTEIAGVYKTLLHRMRNIAKTNYRGIEVKEKRKPRIQFCGYSVTSNDNTPVNLCKGTNGAVFFNGIANCGSYWRCPVCAVKISEHKKELLSGLISLHQNSGLKIGFITLTVRHTRILRLGNTLAKILDNYRRFQNTRFFKQSKGILAGQVKTLEITWSADNGWHPHLHLLYFYNDTVTDIDKFQKSILKNWVNFRDNNATLTAQNQKVLTTDISDYVAKYDITMEMTKGQIKSAKGLTPFTALAKLAVNDFDGLEQKRLLYGIYAEYVEQTHGRHFVNISNSLREMYADFINETDKSDDEIVNETDIEKILLKISVAVWLKICKNDLQPLVINKYKDSGVDGVVSLLSYFRDFAGLSVEIDNNDYINLNF